MGPKQCNEIELVDGDLWLVKDKNSDDLTHPAVVIVRSDGAFVYLDYFLSHSCVNVDAVAYLARLQAISTPMTEKRCARHTARFLPKRLRLSR